MNTPESLFAASQAHISRAEVARFEGREADWKDEMTHCYALQLEAADMLADRRDCEPTRGVLHMSAASIAMRLKRYDEAIAICERGLDGEPDDYTRHWIGEVMRLSRERKENNANPTTTES